MTSAELAALAARCQL